MDAPMEEEQAGYERTNEGGRTYRDKSTRGKRAIERWYKRSRRNQTGGKEKEREKGEKGGREGGGGGKRRWVEKGKEESEESR